MSVESLAVKKPQYDELIGLFESLIEDHRRDISIDNEILRKFVRVLNDIFDDKTCVDVLYTDNIDNMFFGIRVNPTINNLALMSILMGGEGAINLDRYAVEIDSKMLDNFYAHELAAYMIEEIAMTLAPATIEELQAFLDVQLAIRDETIDLRNSVNYSQILIYGIKDAIKKLSSILYKLTTDRQDLIARSDYIKAFDATDSILGMLNKLKSVAPQYFVDPQTSLMTPIQWVLMIYTDLKLSYKDAIATLTDAKAFTGSQLEKDEIDKTIKALNRAASEILVESKNSMEYFEELGLFKGLKKKGLKTIEDDLYEFKLRFRNVDTEQDALYLLRQINTRLGILVDYLDADIPDNERKHWQAVVDEYRELRVELGKKKFDKKTFGIWVDYSKLDELDRDKATNWYA